MEQWTPFVTALQEVRQLKPEEPWDPVSAAFASMMEACARGEGPRFRRVGQRDSRVEWSDSQGYKRAFTMDAREGVRDVENPPDAGLGGLPWPAVRETIEKHAKDYRRIRTVIYEPVEQPGRRRGTGNRRR